MTADVPHKATLPLRDALATGSFAHVLMQIEFQRTGRYQDPDDFTID